MNGNLFLLMVKGMFQCVKIAITVGTNAGHDGCPDCDHHHRSPGYPIFFAGATRLADV